VDGMEEVRSATVRNKYRNTAMESNLMQCNDSQVEGRECSRHGGG